MDEQRLTSVLVEFASTLIGDFSIQKILDHLVDRVVEVIPVDGAGVLLMDSDSEHHFVAASDDAILEIESLQMTLQEGPCLEAYRSGEHVAVRDLATDEKFTRFSPAAAAAGLGAVYSFPLRLDNRQLGALELYAKEPLELSKADLVGAQILADVTAAYLFNAQAREAARDLARHSAELSTTLQQSLLPPELPEVPGLEVAAHLLPGRGGSLVGGDLYDVFPLPGRRWGVLLGDVVGHGAPAATLAALARYTVRTLAAIQNSPRRVLMGLNEMVIAREEHERFLSAIYLTVKQTDQGVGVRLARGGHPGALLRRVDGTVEVVLPPGGLIGLTEDPGMKECKFGLAHGEMLLLYTDGVTEGRRGSEQFGDQRLRDLLTSTEPCANTVVEATLAAVLEHSEGDLADDVAVLALLAT